MLLFPFLFFFLYFKLDLDIYIYIYMYMILYQSWLIIAIHRWKSKQSKFLYGLSLSTDPLELEADISPSG